MKGVYLVFWTEHGQRLNTAVTTAAGYDLIEDRAGPADPVGQVADIDTFIALQGTQ
ncbi:hypothetical protein [Nocardia sp. R6R-6]|uniref:hypothetical protein n=1 Tax=Nocardia sp. R6R-6 TaxID=3459303 RepID=UPI00403D5B41